MSPQRRWPLLLLLLSACGTANPSATSPGSASAVGKNVALSLPSSTGARVSIGNGGQPLVLDFWSPECKPCRETIPALVHRKSELEAKGASLLLVAVLARDESTDAAKATLASWGVTESFLIDRDNVSMSAAGVRDLPATVVLDAQHNLKWTAPENATPDDVIAAVGD
jgi:thiol-disulfide isomerase/thioredoxin